MTSGTGNNLQQAPFTKLPWQLQLTTGLAFFQRKHIAWQSVGCYAQSFPSYFPSKLSSSSLPLLSALIYDISLCVSVYL